MKPQIYKIQIPLATNGSPPLALVYNERRNHEGLFPVTDDLLKIMRWIRASWVRSFAGAGSASVTRLLAATRAL